MQTWVSGAGKCSQCGGNTDVRQVFYTWMINAPDEDLTEKQRQIRDRRNKFAKGEIKVIA
jgi:hypothetical protein